MKKYYIETLGCQMNYSDSERINTVLEKLKYFPAKKEEEADIIIYNTCSVRQKPEDRILGMRKKWQAMKKKNEDLILGITGCMVSHKKYNLKNRLPEIDMFFEIGELPELPAQLGEIEQNKKANDDYFKIVPKSNSRFQANVPIMTGCDNYCGYCIVPYTRGREKSRPVAEILAETKKLVEGGAVEVSLLGQNVNSYKGEYNGETIEISKLLELVNNIKGIKRIRFISSHPKDMSEELVKAVHSLENVCEQIHLPVQAGNNEVLKNMNRKYTREQYLTLINKIRKINPEIAITTDIIVGFPSESKEQFEDSASLIREAKFDMAYILKYSSRPGTAAAKMKDDVSCAEKKRRFRVLTDFLAEITLEHNKKLTGKRVEVLVEKVRKTSKEGLIKGTGRTRTGKLVSFEGEKVKVGDLVDVKIMEAKEWVLEGEISMQK